MMQSTCSPLAFVPKAVLRNLKTAIAQAPESEKSRSGRCHQLHGWEVPQKSLMFFPAINLHLWGVFPAMFNYRRVCISAYVYNQSQRGPMSQLVEVITMLRRAWNSLYRILRRMLIVRNCTCSHCGIQNPMGLSSY